MHTCTVKARIIEPWARTLDLPLLVRGASFLLCFRPPFPEEEISDYIAHGVQLFEFFRVGDDKRCEVELDCYR